MVTNPVFEAETSYLNADDVELFEDVLIDAIQQRGIDVLYFPRTQVVVDDIFNEVTVSAFNNAGSFRVEMLLETVEGLQANTLVLSRIGMTAAPITYTWTVARRRFRDEADATPVPISFEPRKGDILIAEHHKLILEIKNVIEANPFVGPGRSIAFTIQAEPWHSNTENYANFGEDAGEDLGVDQGDIDEFLGIDQEPLDQNDDDIPDEPKPYRYDVVVEEDR